MGAEEPDSIRPDFQPCAGLGCYNQTLTPDISRAGRWFLDSGIQEINGGVARYHRTDLNQNAPISTEITGYAVSAFVYFYRTSGDEAYLHAAKRSADYLMTHAWDAAGSAMPFEPLSPKGEGFMYFFDCGIIVRGLLALWRATRDSSLLERAKQITLSMAFDFLGDGCFYPIVQLPEKQPLPFEQRWSRSPGCYQLKSALAWRDISEASGQPEPLVLWEQMLAFSLATHDAFLPGDDGPQKTMDRLHAYCYFLEALLAGLYHTACREALAVGIGRVSTYLREIRGQFERSDVNAQLLRVRIMAAAAGAVTLDETAAREEALATASFRREDGGFWFGRKDGEFLPFSNPVSTAFCAQALGMWKGAEISLPELI